MAKRLIKKVAKHIIKANTLPGQVASGVKGARKLVRGAARLVAEAGAKRNPIKKKVAAKAKATKPRKPRGNVISNALSGKQAVRRARKVR